MGDLPLCLIRTSVLCDLYADDGTLITANDNLVSLSGWSTPDISMLGLVSSEY